MKTVSYLALVTAICVVIFAVFMALRPANAQAYRLSDNSGRFHGYVTWPLYLRHRQVPGHLGERTERGEQTN